MLTEIDRLERNARQREYDRTHKAEKKAYYREYNATNRDERNRKAREYYHHGRYGKNTTVAFSVGPILLDL